MELSKHEIQSLKGLVQTWQNAPEIELEATFGFKGVVNQQTFLRVVSRLKAKGYEAIPQEDRLTISLVDTPGQKTISDHVRFTLSGSGQITQYCLDNTITDKPYIAIIKDRNITQAKDSLSNIDITEYDVRVKARREIELKQDDPRVLASLENWATKRKFMRLIRRWTFKTPDSSGLIYDLSVTRSTKAMGSTREGAWQINFQDQPIAASAPNYEIEVELEHSSFPPGSDPEKPFQSLIRGMGDILRGIQGSPILTRKSTTKDVLRAYQDLTKTDRFRGVAPVTLELKNMVATPDPGVPSIRSGYNVTDKADGLRVHGFTDSDGELFMIDMAMNVYRTGFKQPSCASALLDGEYITRDRQDKPIQTLLFFDIYYANKKDVTKLPFKEDGKDCRHDEMQQWFMSWNKEGGATKTLKTAALLIGLKTFYFTKPNDTKTAIFTKSSDILQKVQQYYTDGLIYTPNMLPLPSNPGTGFLQQFKWKPSKDNSIDFLVRFVKETQNKETDKVTVGIHPTTNKTVSYKTLQLFVGSSDDPAYRDPRSAILNDLPLPGSRIGDYDARRRAPYKPVPFVPIEHPDPKAAICHLEIEIDPSTQDTYVTTEKEEPIRDKSIVEMRYDATQPEGWRWIPMRVRVDKTERLLKGTYERTLNAEKTAEGIWNSIHEPITEYMIRSGSEVPSEAEIAELNLKLRSEPSKYFERKASKYDINKVSGLRKFHNVYVKDTILYGNVKKQGDTFSLVDLTVGKAADIQRWRRAGMTFVLGVDIVGDNIRNPADGAYRRLLDSKVRAQDTKDVEPIPPMFFAIADSSLRLKDGSAGANADESNILRSILTEDEIMGLPVAIEKYGKKVLAEGSDVVSCMHSIHYFFENPEKLNGFLQNIADNLKIGGHFIGTNFDGGAVFDKLRGLEEGQSRTGMDGDTILWEIEKQYSLDELPNDDSGFGIPVNVFFISIGITHKEYLVPWDLFVAKMKTIGCELVLNDMYGNDYTRAMKTRDAAKFRMSSTVQEFSFLYRWYVFKRTSQGSGEIGKLLGDVETVKPIQRSVAGTTVVAEPSLQTKTVSVVQETPGIQVPGGAAAAASVISRINAAKTAEALSKMEELQSRITDSKLQGNQAEVDRATAELQTLEEQMTVQQQQPRMLVPIAPQPGSGSLAATAPTLAQAQQQGQQQGQQQAQQQGQQQQEQQIQGQEALTVPVQRGPTKKYKLAEVFKIYETSGETDKYVTLPEKWASYASRHMAPNAPFRIVDTTDATDPREYPSITHFLAGMKLKYASSQPQQAAVFTREGSIHTSFLAERMAKQKGKAQAISKKAHNELIVAETNAVKTDEARLLGTPSVRFDESKWAPIKEKLLRAAITQRLTNDKWFCMIALAAHDQGKLLLYVDEDAATRGSDLGGILLNGKLSGQNRYGFLIEELVNTMPDTLKACLTLPDPF